MDLTGNAEAQSFLDDDLEQQVWLGQMTLEAAMAQQQQRNDTFGPAGKAQDKMTDPEGTVAVNQQLNEQTAEDWAEQKEQNAFYDTLRQYALDLIGGKYLPDEGQMVQSAIGRLPVEYSQQNQALVSNIASNNLSGSGFQRREGMQLNQNQAYETQTKRQSALQEHAEKKRQQTAEGYDRLLDLEDQKKKDAADREERNAADREERGL